MKKPAFVRHHSSETTTAGSEPLWQTAIGCALVWAALLALCWML